MNIIRQFLVPAVVAVLYFLLAVISFNFSKEAGNATLIWLSSGFAIAAILRYGYSTLYGVYIGGTFASLYVGNSLVASLMIAIANTSEPLIAYLLISQFQFSNKLYHFRDYSTLIVMGLVAAVSSAIIGALSLYFNLYISAELLTRVTLHWWVGNAVAIVLVAPLCLFLVQPSFYRAFKSNLVEVFFLLVATVIVSLTLFAGIDLGLPVNTDYGHFIAIMIAWALIRFNHQIISLILSLFFLFGVWGFINQQGYFYHGVENEEGAIHALLQYILFVSVGAMAVAYISKTRSTLSQALLLSQTETYLIDRDTLEFEYINDAALNKLGLTGHKIRDLSMLDICTRESVKKVKTEIASLSEGSDEVGIVQCWHQTLDGTLYPVETRLQFIEQDGQQFILATSIDISERHENQLQKELGDNVCEHTSQGVMICDSQSNIIRVNPAFTEITGYSMQEVIGKNPNILQSGKHDSLFFASIFRSLNLTGEWHGELYNRHQQGHLYLINMQIKKVFNDLDENHKYIALFTDITSQREHALRLKHKSEHDILTMLPNRVRLQEEFKIASSLAKRQSQKMAVLFLDLNGFKPINDTFGHQFGDHVLKVLADRLSNTIRESDTVARIGGDEFVVLMTNIDDESVVLPFIEKIKRIIAEPLNIDNRELSLSVSIGCAFYPDNDSELDALISIADDKMYQDKQRHKNATKTEKSDQT